MSAKWQRSPRTDGKDYPSLDTADFAAESRGHGEDLIRQILRQKVVDMGKI